MAQRPDASTVLASAPWRTLLTGAIDYAGLFPPASLDMATVVANYAQYRAGADAWALGRLVVPASQLAVLRDAWGAAGPGVRATGARPWPLSVLVAADGTEDAARVAAFVAEAGDWAVVASIESRAASPAQVGALAGRFPGVEHFIELPLDAELVPLVRAVGRIGAMAKVRTGGVTREAIPTSRDVARFLRVCADEGVPCKATAGLHHPLRGEYRLTYAPDAERATMFGWANVLVAATQARLGAPVEALVATLEATSFPGLAWSGDRLHWASGELRVADIAAARDALVRSFGSCSFREPLDEADILLLP